jgi:hypothetical protein
MTHTTTERQAQMKTLRRLALGLLAALAVMLATEAAPLTGTAHAESVSGNAGAVHHCAAPDIRRDYRATGEEIPQTLAVADGCRTAAVSHAGSAVAGGLTGGVRREGSKPGGTGEGLDRDGSAIAPHPTPASDANRPNSGGDISL